MEGVQEKRIKVDGRRKVGMKRIEGKSVSRTVGRKRRDGAVSQEACMKERNRRECKTNVGRKRIEGGSVKALLHYALFHLCFRFLSRLSQIFHVFDTNMSVSKTRVKTREKSKTRENIRILFHITLYIG